MKVIGNNKVILFLLVPELNQYNDFSIYRLLAWQVYYPHQSITLSWT